MALIPERTLLNGWNTFLERAQNIRASHNALKMIVTEHERVHAGMAWLNKDEYFISPNTTAYYAFHISSFDNSAHLRNFGFVSDQGPMKLHFREGPSIDVNSLGTLLSMKNMNRNAPDECGMTLYGSPVVDVNSLGEHLDFIFQPESAPGNQPAGGSAQNAATEWQINISKWYLFTLENTTANTATIESQLFIYRTGNSLK